MKKVGLLVPKTNLTVEYELQYLYNNHFFNIEDIAFYISKLDYKTSYKEDKTKFLNDLAKDSNKKINLLGEISIMPGFFIYLLFCKLVSNVFIPHI